MKNLLMFFVVLALVLCGSAAVFAGVRQMRSVDSLRETDNTNVGTNAYADMDSGNGYATVNPNYSDRATVYRGEEGAVAVDPRDAAIANETGIAVYNGYGAVVAGGYYYDYNGWAATAPDGALIPIGIVLEYLPSRAVPLMVKGSRYYYVDNIYLAEVFDGTAVVYQVVPAPLGAVVTMLPPGCTVRYLDGRPLSYCGTTVYRQVAGGYEVVASN